MAGVLRRSSAIPDKHLHDVSAAHFAGVRTTIRTKSIYDKKGRIDGLRILVSRFYPRGVKRERFDLWIRGASPQRDLLKSYKQGLIDWPEFERRFKLQLKTEVDSKAAMKQLLELSRRRNITLLCYEKEGQKCHRQVLKTTLERLLRRRSKL